MVEITMEFIEKREKALMADFERTRSDMEAIGGALQDCAFWREVLEAENADRYEEPDEVGGPEAEQAPLSLVEETVSEVI